MIKSFSALFFVAALIVACSSPKQPQAYIKAQISVADSLDSSGNFSGIGYLIIKRDSTQKADTVFYAETDKNGAFEGRVSFPEKGIFPVYISRNRKIISSSSIILAEHDTLHISAELPGYNQTEKISSVEYDAQNSFSRIKRNFDRIVLFANAGKLSNDTLPKVLKNWSDLFWSVYEKHPNTYAAEQSVIESMKLLVDWNDSLLLKRYETLKDNSKMRIMLAKSAAEAVRSGKGLDASIAYLEKIRKETTSVNQDLQIIRNQAELLVDSNRYAEAEALIQKNKKRFDKIKGADSWAKYFQRETGALAPGKSLPSFKLSSGKDTLSNASFTGSYYVLEITGLADNVYQSQFGSVKAMFALFQQSGLQWLTVPLDPQVTIDAFLEEQKPAWKFANAHDFESNPLLDSLNIIEVPTRFLMDKNGKIIRKYHSNELERLSNDYLEVYQKSEQPHS